MGLDLLLVYVVATALTFGLIYRWASAQPNTLHGRVKASDWGSYNDQSRGDPNEISVDLDKAQVSKL